jgi:hypothetical protein
VYRSTFLDLGTSWRRVVSFTTLLLYPRGKVLPLLTGYEDPESVWRTRSSENCLPYWDSNPDPSVVKLVAIRSADCAERMKLPNTAASLETCSGQRTSHGIHNTIISSSCVPIRQRSRAIVPNTQHNSKVEPDTAHTVYSKPMQYILVHNAVLT